MAFLSLTLRVVFFLGYIENLTFGFLVLPKMRIYQDLRKIPISLLKKFLIRSFSLSKLHH
ncbi:hypothetical protein AXF35_15045 [Legionella pneumophila subsp. pascullei]|nr:hypothetical protein AXF35_15045 [Legionella pneumophila subsp. pascullei]